MSELFSIIIPNWNGAHYLPTCLNSLAAQTYAPIEVWVVDNDSHDETKTLLAERYPWVKLLALPENRGFTGACNAGIAAA